MKSCSAGLVYRAFNGILMRSNRGIDVTPGSLYVQLKKTLTVLIRTHFLAQVLAQFFAASAWAKIDVMIWQPNENGPSVLLPYRTQSMDPKLGLQELLQSQLKSYISAILSSPELASLREPRDINSLQSARLNVAPLAAHFTRPEASDTSSSKVLVGINANKISDMVEASARGHRVAKIFARNSSLAYIIGLAAEINLTPAEQVEFHATLNERLDLMVSLGGRDVHPALYGQSITHSVNPNYLADVLELERIKSFKASQSGVFIGFCRGHQIGAVADGHELFQDIEKDGLAPLKEHLREGEELREKQAWHHIAVEESLLKRFLNGDTSLLTNSLHHQAVKLNPKGKSFPIAFHGRVIEAMQMHNGLGISFQFHPEFPESISGSRAFSTQGESIIRSTIAYARLKRMEARSASKMKCSSIFSTK